MERDPCGVRVGIEILQQRRRTVEADDSHPVRNVAHHRGNHRVQVPVGIEPAPARPARLHRNHQRQWLSVCIPIQRELLLDAVIGNPEVVCFQREDQLPLRIQHQRRNQHHGRLSAQRRSLQSRWRLALPKRDKRK